MVSLKADARRKPLEKNPILPETAGRP